MLKFVLVFLLLYFGYSFLEDFAGLTIGFEYFLLIFVIILIIIDGFKNSRKKKRESAISYLAHSQEEKPARHFYSAESELYAVDCMGGHAFEYWCADLLRANGYSNVSVTKGSGDQGADIIAYNGAAKCAIQCKCYSSDLGNKPVQEVMGAMAYYDCLIGIVMTNRHFTTGAEELARKANIILWDREVLKSMIENEFQSRPAPKETKKRERTTIKSEMFPHNPDSPDIDADYYRELPHVEYPNDSKSFVKAYCDCDMATLRAKNPDEIITITSEPFDVIEEAEHFAKAIEKHCCGITHVDGNRVVGRFHVCSVAANWSEEDNTFTFANWA